MTTESDVWRRVRGAWDGHAIRVEASMGGVDPGTPDCALAPRGRGSVWVELKVWPEPVSPVQVAWAVDCEQRGGLCFLLCENRGDYWIGRAEEYAELREVAFDLDLQAALKVIASAGIKRKSSATKPVEAKRDVASQTSIQTSGIQKRR